MSELGKRSLKGRHRGCRGSQQWRVCSTLDYILNNDPVFIFSRIFVPALELYASAWCA